MAFLDLKRFLGGASLLLANVLGGCDGQAGDTNSDGTGGEGGSSAGGSAHFETLVAEDCTSIDDAGTESFVDLILTQDELDYAWALHTTQEAPVVNFDERAVIHAYYGEVPNCGYLTTLGSIETSEDDVNVEVVRSAPDSTCNENQLVAYPFAFFSIQRPQGEVHLSEVEKTHDCPEDAQ